MVDGWPQSALADFFPSGNVRVEGSKLTVTDVSVFNSNVPSATNNVLTQGSRTFDFRTVDFRETLQSSTLAFGMDPSTGRTVLPDGTDQWTNGTLVGKNARPDPQSPNGRLLGNTVQAESLERVKTSASPSGEVENPADLGNKVETADLRRGATDDGGLAYPKLENVSLPLRDEDADRNLSLRTWTLFPERPTGR